MVVVLLLLLPSQLLPFSSNLLVPDSSFVRTGTAPNLLACLSTQSGVDFGVSERALWERGVEDS